MQTFTTQLSLSNLVKFLRSTVQWNGESRDSLKRPVPPFRMVRAGVGGVTPSVHYYGNGGGIGHQPQSATWNGQHSPIAEVVTVKTPHRQRISVGSIEEDDDPETPI